jgi:hypothetical protein
MLVSVASFLPIIVVGPISDLVGTTTVIFVVALSVMLAGVASLLWRGPLQAADAQPASDPNAIDPIAAALGADRPTWRDGAEMGVATSDPLDAAGIPSGLERAGPSDPTDRD